DSDAYATGTALVALHQAGGVATADPAYRNGLRFLLAKQLDDGSWHVPTRSTPIQTYYESGYPHGEDQFITITAAGWATTALALALPEAQAKAAELDKPTSALGRSKARAFPATSRRGRSFQNVTTGLQRAHSLHQSGLHQRTQHVHRALLGHF